jgi:hypothetical protein
MNRDLMTRGGEGILHDREVTRQASAVLPTDEIDARRT